MIAVVATVVGGYWYYAQDLPDIHQMADYQPPQVTRVLAADGTPIAEYFEERRTVISRAHIPDVLVQAVLSAEDGEFYKHQGLDFTGMARALYNSARAGRLTGSGSTITQQTVKNLLLTPERSFSRKAKEIILTRRLEQRLTKDDILTIYMNAIYLGHGRWGVQEAARFYFGKDVKQLSIGEAAMLAGVIQSPERHSPVKHPEQARRRQKYVLGQMVKNGHITAKEAATARAKPMALIPKARRNVPEAMWFVDAVRKAVEADVGRETFINGGLTIQTTLQLDKQHAALKALHDGLQMVDARHKYGQPTDHIPDKKRAAWKKKRAKALKGKAPSPGRIIPGRLKAVVDGDFLFELGVGEILVPRRAIERFLTAEDAKPYKTGDILWVSARADGPRYPKQMRGAVVGAPQGAMVVIDPRSRDVVAMVGGWDWRDHPFNRATRARRQPGSAFKPLVWGAAYETRRFTPATELIDAPETYRISKGKWWKPKNYTRRFKGPISLRTALAHSVNSIAVKLADDVGVSAVQDLARRAGVTSPLADNLTLALGSSEVSPLELANAYATIATGGKRRSPRLITAINKNGKILPTEGTKKVGSDAVIDPEIAWLIRSTMRSVVLEGSGRRLKKIPRPVAGKTGTTNDARDAWFVGLLPEAVTVAWVGFDEPRSLGRKESGGRTAAPIVAAYLEKVATKGPDWPKRPNGVIARMVVPGGLLAPPGAKGAYEEYFLVGTAPTKAALPDGEVDATGFMFEETDRLAPEDPNRPTLEVPKVPVKPLPGSLTPLAPISAKPVKPISAKPETKPLPINPEDLPWDDEDRPSKRENSPDR